MELGEEFPEPQAEGRAPTINDLWEAAEPMGPYIITALRARELHRRDVNYIVRDGEVKIVNPSTGRVMPTSRWTDDLHQVRIALLMTFCILQGLAYSSKGRRACYVVCQHHVGGPCCDECRKRIPLLGMTCVLMIHWSVYAAGH